MSGTTTGPTTADGGARQVGAGGRGRNGYDDPDLLIGVAAGELLEWAWLAGELAEWLINAADTTAHDHAHRFPHGPDLARTAWMLEQISERIAALLDDDRGQP